MFDYLFWFPVVWVLSFICHEFMHCFEHGRQDGRRCDIRLERWYGIPTMCVYMSGVSINPRMVELAGGLYTSIVHFVVLLVYLIFFGFHQSAFVFSVICIGVVQYFYGYYEMLYLSKLEHDMYMVGHYIVYFIVISIFLIVWILI